MKKIMMAILVLSLLGCTKENETASDAPQIVEYAISNTLEKRDATPFDLDLLVVLSMHNEQIDENDEIILRDIDDQVVYFQIDRRDYDNDLYYTRLVASINLITQEYIQYDLQIDHCRIIYLKRINQDFLYQLDDGFYYNNRKVFDGHGYINNATYEDGKIYFTFSNLKDTMILCFDETMEIIDTVKGTFDNSIYYDHEFYYLKEGVIYNKENTSIAKNVEDLFIFDSFIYNHGEVIDLHTLEKSKVDFSVWNIINNRYIAYNKKLISIDYVDDHFEMIEYNIDTSDLSVLIDDDCNQLEYVLTYDDSLGIYYFYTIENG